MTSPGRRAIVVAGESVVDLVPAADGLIRPVLGGGPANIAVTVARLGVPVRMLARLGADDFGRRVRVRLVDAGVDPQYLVPSGDPSTLALVTLDDAGRAEYDFWLNGAADFGWRESELPPLPGDATADVAVAALHVGSLAAFVEPGASALERLVARVRGELVVSFDPNLRPAALDRLDGGLPAARHRLDRLCRLAHLIKVSDEDLAAAYPGTPPEQVAADWLGIGGGPQLVVLTLGGHGAVAFTRTTRVAVPAVPVEVADTIGAGDTAMGALLAELYRRDLLGDPATGRLTGLTGDELTGILTAMTTAAAITCTRAGADPPTGDELAAALRDR